VTRAFRRRRALSGFLEGTLQINAANVPGGEQAENQTRQQRHSEREAQNEWIDADLVHSREVLRDQEAKGVDAPVGQEQTERASHSRENHTSRSKIGARCERVRLPSRSGWRVLFAG